MIAGDGEDLDDDDSDYDYHGGDTALYDSRTDKIDSLEVIIQTHRTVADKDNNLYNVLIS